MVQLRTRFDGGGTPKPERWGDSEYATVRDVLILRRDRVGR